WEKQKPGESFKQSALRALAEEELQLTGEITMLDQGQFEYVEPPIDYPGLETYLRGASFVVYLSKEQFEALRAGHTEVQERKQNHFKWREL
ncbi:MAG: hypothetical protein KDD70_16855, partial [Bdellovibrionales bacterium]|nr:hypothetical protein [Bdellovibrionales bacterium]